MSTILVGGRLGTHAIAQLSFECPLKGATPSEYLRWAWAKAAGMSEQEATTYALGRKAPKSPAELSQGSKNKTVRLTEDVAVKVRSQYPGKSDSWIMRYVVALHSGYTPDQAEAIASTDRRKKNAA